MGSLWRESGLNWTDLLPEGEDVQAFISQQVWKGKKGAVDPSSEKTFFYFYYYYFTGLSLLPFPFTQMFFYPSHPCHSPLLSFLFLLCSKQKLQFLQSEGSSPEEVQTKRILSPEELRRQLEKLLLEDMVSDEQIFDWVEVRHFNPEDQLGLFISHQFTTYTISYLTDYHLYWTISNISKSYWQKISLWCQLVKRRRSQVNIAFVFLWST